MSAVEVRMDPAWPADVAAFAVTAAGRSFATTPAFRRAFDTHGPAWPARVFGARAEGGRGVLVGVLAGNVERRFGGAWFRSLPFGAPAGPLFSPDLVPAERASVARALWDALERQSKREGWLGGDVTLSGPAAHDATLAPGPGLGSLRHDEAHVIDVGAGFDAWRGSLRKRARQQFTRAERFGVSVRRGDAGADLARVHELHAEQARHWGVKTVRPLAFYRALLEPPTSAVLWVGQAEGRVECGVLAFVEPGETYVWWSGASIEARRRVAFPYLLMRVVAECGSARVSLGFSGGLHRLTDFKEQMGAEGVTVPILELIPRPRTPYHALLVYARDRARERARARAQARVHASAPAEAEA